MEKDSIAEMALSLLTVMGCPSCGAHRFKIQSVMNWTNLTCVQCEKVITSPPGQAVEMNVQIKIMGDDNTVVLGWHTAKTGNVLERLKDA